LFKASVYQFFIFLSFTFNAVAQERSDVNAADIFLIENTINLSTPVAGSAHLLGQTIYITAPIAGPLYASGQSITLSTPVATVGDTAHLLAQTITIGSAIKGALYATGQSVLINGPVSKNVQIAGERIQVKGQIDGHLRAFGEHIELHAPIFGSAYVRGETVVIASVIHQDLDIKAQKIEFKEGAELLGKLRLSETTELSGPALTTLISEDRVTMTPAPTALFERGKPVPPNLWLLQQVGFILKIGVLMILFGLFMPHRNF
jgi:cytoskeletal protein CcmA (bactofilin family)